jgi:transposase
VAVREEQDGLRLEWNLIEERHPGLDAREGTCLLRRNLKVERTEKRLKKYIQLTEAAFRALKSELAIRPIFHQKEHLVKTHILAFVASKAKTVLYFMLARSVSHLFQTSGISV